jgi:hypothetical protein
MRVVAVIASDVDGQEAGALGQGDRAAVHWGVSLAGQACEALVPPGDAAAWCYATAVGARVRPWDERQVVMADLVLIGPGAIDAYGDDLAGRWAERLSTELLFDGLQLERDETTWKIACDAGSGARDVLHVEGGVVIVVSQFAARPPYVSRFRLAQAARQIPKANPRRDRTSKWQPVTPRPPRPVSAENADAGRRANAAFGIDFSAPSGSGRKIIAESPAVCAQVLLRYLVHYGFVSRSLPDVADTPVASRRSPVETEYVSMPGADSELTGARRRGPRRGDGALRRRSRRPRPVSSSPPAAAAADSRSRRPRRVAANEAAPQRSPIRLPSNDQQITSEGRL